MGELYVPIVGANGLVWLWVVGGLHYVVMVETLLGWAMANRGSCNPGLQLLQFYKTSFIAINFSNNS